MNRSELRDRTRQLAGAELDGLRDDAEVNALISEKYAQIGHLYDWKWRETTDTFVTVDGTAEYSVPAGIEHVRGLHITDAPGHSLPVQLSEVTFQELLTRVRRDDEQLPRFYARTGGDKVRLGPIPDAVYTVEVFGLAPLQQLESDAAEPEFAEQFHPAIAYLAAAQFLLEEGQTDLAQTRRAQAEEFLTDMVKHYQLSKDLTPIVMGGGRRMQTFRDTGRLWPRW